MYQIKTKIKWTIQKIKKIAKTTAIWRKSSNSRIRSNSITSRATGIERINPLIRFWYRTIIWAVRLPKRELPILTWGCPPVKSKGFTSPSLTNCLKRGLRVTPSKWQFKCLTASSSRTRTSSKIEFNQSKCKWCSKMQCRCRRASIDTSKSQLPLGTRQPIKQMPTSKLLKEQTSSQKLQSQQETSNNDLEK